MRRPTRLPLQSSLLRGARAAAVCLPAASFTEALTVKDQQLQLVSIHLEAAPSLRPLELSPVKVGTSNGAAGQAVAL